MGHASQMSTPLNRQYPEHPIVGVGAVIIENKKILMVRRATEPLKGEWSLPGGVVELGETLADAVKREVREETGFKIEVDEVTAVLDRIFPDHSGKTEYHYVLIDYLCRPIGGMLPLADARLGLAWYFASWSNSAALSRIFA